MARRAAAVAAAGIVAGGALAACSSRGAPPSAGDRLPPPPSLRGATVMVVPVQYVRGISGDADAEIAFALRESGGRVEWVFPDEIRRALARSPGVEVRLDALAVDDFRVREVERIGDPLYGELYRLAALTDAHVGLVPILASRRAATPERPAAVEITAALIHPRSGRVLWFGVVDGPLTDGDEARSLAGAAQSLARALLPLAEPPGEGG